jgi:hypothetical protein
MDCGNDGEVEIASEAKMNFDDWVQQLHALIRERNVPPGWSEKEVLPLIRRLRQPANDAHADQLVVDDIETVLWAMHAPEAGFLWQEKPEQKSEASASDWLLQQMPESLRVAIERYLSRADHRYSTQSRKFSIFRILEEEVVPAFEQLAADGQAPVEFAPLFAVVFACVRARDLPSAVAALFKARARWAGESSSMLGCLDLILREAEARRPSREGNALTGRRSLTTGARQPTKVARHRIGSAQFCMMCDCATEAHSGAAIERLESQPAMSQRKTRLSGSYCFLHKTSGQMASGAYRRALERLPFFQRELSRIVLLLNGEAHRSDLSERSQLVLDFWRQVIKSLQRRKHRPIGQTYGREFDEVHAPRRSESYDFRDCYRFRERYLRRLAALASYGTYRLSDERKIIAMMYRDLFALEEIAQAAGITASKVALEIARIDSWLPEDFKVLLREERENFLGTLSSCCPAPERLDPHLVRDRVPT